MDEHVTADQRCMIFADRTEGLTYAVISKKHGVPEATVARWCRQQGFPHRPSYKMPDAEYNAHWIARVRERCAVDANGCWLWPGSKNHKGYGMTNYRGETRNVHRKMFEVVNGVKLQGGHVCHSCDVRNCCNPGHLWFGDAHRNQMDSASKKRHRCARATECPKGHPYDEANTYISANGARHCKACARGRQRVAKGWPEDQAYSAPPVPFGYSREDVR